jgi:hypothetical protein
MCGFLAYQGSHLDFEIGFWPGCFAANSAMRRFVKVSGLPQATIQTVFSVAGQRIFLRLWCHRLVR